MTFMAVSCCWRLLKALKKHTKQDKFILCTGTQKGCKKILGIICLNISVQSVSLTCGPGSLLLVPGKRWWRRSVWDLAPPPAEPKLPSWRTSYSDRCDTGSYPDPGASPGGGEEETGRKDRRRVKQNSIFILFFYSNVIFKVLAHHQTARLLPVHEALRDGVGSQNLVSANKNNIQWNIKTISNTNLHYNLHFELSLLRFGRSHTQNKLMVNSVDFRFKWKVLLLFCFCLNDWWRIMSVHCPPVVTMWNYNTTLMWLKNTNYFTFYNPAANYIYKKVMFISGELTTWCQEFHTV